MLVPNVPFRRMRLLALTLSPRGFIAFNENLNHFMLRPAQLPAIVHDPLSNAFGLAENLAVSRRRIGQSRRRSAIGRRMLGSGTFHGDTTPDERTICQRHRASTEVQ